MTTPRHAKEQQMKVYWEVTAYGDTIYVDAPTFGEAEQIIERHMGREVLQHCTLKALANLPDGEEALS